MFIHSPTVGPRFGRLLCVCWPLKNTTDQPGHKKISKLCDPFFPRKKNSSEKDRLLFSNSFLGDEPTSLLLFFSSLKDIYISFSSFFSLSLSRFSFSSSVWTHLAASRHIPPLFSRLVDSRVCVCRQQQQREWFSQLTQVVPSRSVTTLSSSLILFLRRFLLCVCVSGFQAAS